MRRVLLGEGWSRRQGGADIFRNITGSRLEIIEGMGHDIPKKYRARIADRIIGHFKMVADQPRYPFFLRCSTIAVAASAAEIFDVSSAISGFSGAS